MYNVVGFTFDGNHQLNHTLVCSSTELIFHQIVLLNFETGFLHALQLLDILNLFVVCTSTLKQPQSFPRLFVLMGLWLVTKLLIWDV